MMTTTAYLKTALLSVLTMALLLTACDDDMDVEHATLNVNRQASINGKAGAPQCKMDLSICYLTPDTARRALRVNHAIERKLFGLTAPTMQAAADSFANNYTRNYQRDMARLYAEDTADARRQTQYEYRYELESMMKVGRDDIINFIARRDFYEGGAHGHRQTLALNFHERTGQLVTLAQLLVKGYEAPLCELLQEELMVLTNSHSLDELYRKDYLGTADIYVPDNYIVTGTGITFIYNPYEIAPYSMGTIELTLPYKKLKKLLKDKSWT